MPNARINGLDIYYETTGDGFPVVFCHEFAGDYRSWAPQVRYFSRLYRCVTYSCRGFPPSDVPERPEDYSQDLLIADLRGLFEELGIRQAHVVGFSMGGSVVLNFGLRYPELCRSIVAAGAGTGSTNRETFERDVAGVVDLIESKGIKEFAEVYANGPSRQPFKRKDPQGWAEFRERLAEHSPVGQSRTIVGVQLNRPTLLTLEKELDQMPLPVLLIVGDEDEPCIEVGVFLKRHVRGSGLAMVPQTGHTINLEEPALFNRLVEGFFHLVEAGKWANREVVSASLLPK
ncbi:MAG TPA: alpha/beta hydrolase [Chloroflexota bacterium]|nr:alpha/beta hydrolase [Chloroflexota bacterium]